MRVLEKGIRCKLGRVEKNSRESVGRVKRLDERFQEKLPVSAITRKMIMSLDTSVTQVQSSR